MVTHLDETISVFDILPSLEPRERPLRVRAGRTGQTMTLKKPEMVRDAKERRYRGVKSG